MFGPALKFVRALLGAVVLTLIGDGSHLPVSATTGGGEGRAEWVGRKGAKPVPAISARAGAACPLALAAAQGGAVRAPAPAGEVFFRFPAPAGRETSAPRPRREAERSTRPRERSGVVRLLI
jgi:hypothetical protein